jgi:hypothetical protein
LSTHSTSQVLRQEPLAEVRAEKAGAAGDKDTPFVIAAASAEPFNFDLRLVR